MEHSSSLSEEDAETKAATEALLYSEFGVSPSRQDYLEKSAPSSPSHSADPSQCTTHSTGTAGTPTLEGLTTPNATMPAARSSLSVFPSETRRAELVSSVGTSESESELGVSKTIFVSATAGGEPVDDSMNPVEASVVTLVPRSILTETGEIIPSLDPVNAAEAPITTGSIELEIDEPLAALNPADTTDRPAETDTSKLTEASELVRSLGTAEVPAIISSPKAVTVEPLTGSLRNEISTPTEVGVPTPPIEATSLVAEIEPSTSAPEGEKKRKKEKKQTCRKTTGAPPKVIPIASSSYSQASVAAELSRLKFTNPGRRNKEVDINWHPGNVTRNFRRQHTHNLQSASASEGQVSTDRPRQTADPNPINWTQEGGYMTHGRDKQVKMHAQLCGTNSSDPPLYDSRGLLLTTMEDRCDCMRPNCPGCFLPCRRCHSTKCGPLCRILRNFHYEKAEVYL